MTWGTQLAALESEARKGKKVKALQDRPSLDHRQARFYNAFQRCSGSRQVGMAGPGAIPLNQILAYCELYKVHDVEQVEQHVQWIQFLDNVYLVIVAEKQKAAKPPSRK